MTGRSVERRVEIGRLDDEEAPELLLGISIWTVLHRALAVLSADRRCNFRRPKAGAILEYARVPYRCM